MRVDGGDGAAACFRGERMRTRKEGGRDGGEDPAADAARSAREALFAGGLLAVAQYYDK